MAAQSQCATANATRQVHHSVTPATLLQSIDAGRAPVILDVRSGEEFRKGHVPGAVHVPFWRVYLAEIPASTEDSIVVYCGHGPRASIARAFLRLRGFLHVACLAGHYSRWRAAGLRQEKRD